MTRAVPAPSLPVAGRAMWEFVFGNHYPVEIEIGPGTGSFILPAAMRQPHTNFFGIERANSRVVKLESLIAGQRIPNVRVVEADAGCLVPSVIPPASVAAYHIYFPDPWWKRRHQRRRFFTPSFAAALAHTLLPGGRVYLATDVEDVFTSMLRLLSGVTQLVPDPHARSPRTRVTVFEQKGLRSGARIHEATFERLDAMPIAPRYPSSAAPITPAESPS